MPAPEHMPKPQIAPPRVQCVVGETLKEVRSLSEAEWEALHPDRRPDPAEHVPGVGWVVAVWRGRADSPVRLQLSVRTIPG